MCKSASTIMSTKLLLVAATSAVGYLYPLYATYKVLTAASRVSSSPATPRWGLHRDAIQAGASTELADLEAWCMYWSVMAVLRLFETWAEWICNWYVYKLYLRLGYLSIFKLNLVLSAGLHCLKHACVSAVLLTNIRELLFCTKIILHHSLQIMKVI